ncbi:hypothetical protein TNCV_3335161 [Trichonephila clavipes]|nr:hypothetical protein TNCV_3335161 [Trichonephila clavipes]
MARVPLMARDTIFWREVPTWRAVGSLVVRASDSRPEGLGSLPDATKDPPSTHGFTCRNCGGGDRGRVAIYRPFGEFRRAKKSHCHLTATAGSDVVQSGRPIFDDFFQHLWPYIGNNTANVVFQMVKRLWLIRIDQ